ncbi:MAG TPA: antibiotic biosynthesis monooxygenase [Blastocatellia bacterium]
MSVSKELNSTEEAKSIALIITHTIKSGEESRYEAWLADIQRAVSTWPGYLSREIFRPAHGSRKYTSILRFDSLDRLNAWAESETRRSFVEQASHLLESGDQVEIRTGVDFWFTPEGAKPPKPWKQFLLTLTAVYPLSLLIPRLLRPLIALAPPLGYEPVRALLMAMTLTGLLTFVIMPRYTRLMKHWLYDDNA